MSVVDNAVVIPDAATYLVSYSINGSVESDNLEVSLYLNGAPVAGEVITLKNAQDGLSSGSKTILLTTTDSSTLALYNTSGQTATINSSSLTVVKMA
jgi:hypothetical protein